jgi:type I restriction enzyme, R subunit
MMQNKEAEARIKINKMLEEASWRLLDSPTGKANVRLETTIKLKASDLGDDFEKLPTGHADYSLHDNNAFPIAVLEAKSEAKQPLDGKEQARNYARSLNARFVILSNGNLHYLWDIDTGNPELITRFPTLESLAQRVNYKPDKERLPEEAVGEDYIALTQKPNYASSPDWQDETKRDAFNKANKLRFLRHYQLKAVKSIQTAVRHGKSRFLLEMATGTGKTITAAAIIKLFLRTRNATRVLFLVDRLELETQAKTAFTELLKNDYQSVIYKQNRGDWQKAEVVITTVQSLLAGNKYRQLFSPTDFDLVISDEAHRSIGGNSRAVFEYFVGYKLGLTATPKDYLKKVDESRLGQNDPRELERRVLLDTYRTFGCDDGQPTFRYALTDGVKDGCLVNPFVVDARTEITTQLLSKEGYATAFMDEEGNEIEGNFFQKDFERKFFSEPTNRVLCETFMTNALKDPISGEIGKTIVFATSQKHAAKLANILNEMAHSMFPGKYQSDFAMQVTSNVQNAQRMTTNFANNKLGGSCNFIPDYQTSKTRVCVTVGMMTTGYDCTDLINLCLMRPIFSPTEFVQIKGRGTRRHDFSEGLKVKERPSSVLKNTFKLFDFFANCEYFEEKFDYDEVLKLPAVGRVRENPTEPPPPIERFTGEYSNFDPDRVISQSEQQIGLDGMKVDRMLFGRFEERVKADAFIREKLKDENWGPILEHVKKNIFEKPEDYFNMEKLQAATGLDRRATLKELIEKALGLIPALRSKDQVLEEEFQKFAADQRLEEPEQFMPVKYYFKAYATNEGLRNIIDSGELTQLNVNSVFNIDDYRALQEKWRRKVPEYIKDYVPLNQFK